MAYSVLKNGRHEAEWLKLLFRLHSDALREHCFESPLWPELHTYINYQNRPEEPLQCNQHAPYCAVALG